MTVLKNLPAMGDIDDTVVLTPYKNQAAELRKRVRQEGLDETVEVMHTHRAQGREWNTVIFSAVDGTLNLCSPWFTDSTSDHGTVVLNTTLSRARDRLIIVCESGFWTSRREQLLGDLVRIAEKPNWLRA
ncbi:MAG: hypothetical protein HY897_21550 [Deltaproteobacteria bacterium]|nr:hypothetical protein [Deltaproteobacteria bacterium]